MRFNVTAERQGTAQRHRRRCGVNEKNRLKKNNLKNDINERTRSFNPNNEERCDFFSTTMSPQLHYLQRLLLHLLQEIFTACSAPLHKERRSSTHTSTHTRVKTTISIHLPISSPLPYHHISQPAQPAWLSAPAARGRPCWVFMWFFGRGV